jgi:hypothetical protein
MVRGALLVETPIRMPNPAIITLAIADAAVGVWSLIA